MNNRKTSIEKSHSAISNLSLTLLCLFSSIFFSLIFVGFALYIKSEHNLPYLILGIASSILTLFSVILFSKFRR